MISKAISEHVGAFLRGRFDWLPLNSPSALIFVGGKRRIFKVF